MQQISSDQPQAVSEAQSPMGQQGYVPTGQQGNVPTGQQGYVPTGQQGYVPTGQQGYVPTGQQGYVPTGQQGYVPTGQQGYVPTGQQGYVPTGQQGYVPTGQQGYVPTGQQGYVPTGQQGYVPTGQPVQSVPGQAGRMDRTYLKTMLGGSRIFEFILLLIASACGIVYSNRTFGMDGRATFFAGVSTFCWVMVIVLQIGFMLGIHKDQRYFKTPSYSTLIVLAVQVLMAILLIASTTSLAMPAVEWYKVHKDHLDRYGRSMSTDGVNVAMLFCALVGGALTCLTFLEDIPQLTKIYRSQRAKEIAAANTQ
nr:uncharacterized protein LOC131800302 [Pocillopora verrucosa]